MCANFPVSDYNNDGLYTIHKGAIGLMREIPEMFMDIDTLVCNYYYCILNCQGKKHMLVLCSAFV